MSQYFLSLDGSKGPIVVGKKKKFRCKISAKEVNINGISYIEVKSNNIPNYKPAVLDEDGDQIIIRGSWEKELRIVTNNQQGNPNYIDEHDHLFLLPLVPSGGNWKFNNKKELPMGAIGVAINGCLLFNQYADPKQNMDAVETEEFDYCCGHPDALNQYHYHQYPLCSQGNSGLTNSIIENVENYINGLVNQNELSPVVGFMFDGVPLTGPVGYDLEGNIKILQSSYNENKQYIEGSGDLDYYNGILSPIEKDKEPVYHYVSTIKSKNNKVLLNNNNEIIPAFPYMMKAYKYTPNIDNF